MHNVTIPAGQTSANLTVTISDDAILEEEELFNLALSIPPFPASLGMHSASGVAMVTITDDDDPRVSSLLSPATLCLREQVRWSST